MQSPRFIHRRERRNFRYAAVVAFLLAMGALAACKIQYRGDVNHTLTETIAIKQRGYISE
jgi:hypothetical protein